MMNQKFMLSVFDSVFEEAETVSLRDIIRSLRLAPVKSDADEFQFVKEFLGCDKALCFFGADWQKANSARESLRAKILAQVKKLSIAERNAMVRELKAAAILKKIEQRGIPIDLALFQAESNASVILYKEEYACLETEANTVGEKLTPEMVSSTTASFSSEVLNCKLNNLRKLWKHTHVLDFHKLSQSIRNDEGSFRIYCGWENFAAVSGRIQSCSPNVQGFPKRVREKCFIPSIGKALIVADYINEEIAIMGVLAKDTRLLYDIAIGVDLHVKVAATLFKKTIYDVTEAERKLAKRLTFACLYGAGDAALQNMLREAVGVDSLISGRAVRTVIKDMYPAISLLEHKIKKDQKLQFLDGTEIPLEKIPKRYCAVNRLVQGTGAILLKQVLINLESQLPTGAEVICLIHDEVIVEAPLEVLQESSQIVYRVMTSVLQDYDINFRLPVSMAVRKGENYGY